LGGAIGTGGEIGTGGVLGTGGGTTAGSASGIGGMLGSGGGVGGATPPEAGPRDTGSDVPAVALDADVRDVPAVELDAGVRDAPLETPRDDGAIDLPGSETSACTAAGGFCSPSRWQICPAYREPIGQGDGHLDCRNNGWCCVPAPSSPCSDQGAGNCVVGDACTGCWHAAPNTPACETGRVCCVDNCW
jgi:hypothetical protein